MVWKGSRVTSFRKLFEYGFQPFTANLFSVGRSTDTLGVHLQRRGAFTFRDEYGGFGLAGTPGLLVED